MTVWETTLRATFSKVLDLWMTLRRRISCFWGNFKYWIELQISKSNVEVPIDLRTLDLGLPSPMVAPAVTALQYGKKMIFSQAYRKTLMANILHRIICMTMLSPNFVSSKNLKFWPPKITGSESLPLLRPSLIGPGCTPAAGELFHLKLCQTITETFLIYTGIRLFKRLVTNLNPHLVLNEVVDPQLECKFTKISRHLSPVSLLQKNPWNLQISFSSLAVV